MARQASLRRAVILERGRIAIATTEQTDISWLAPRQGVHLVVDSPYIRAADAEFARPSIISKASQSDLLELIPPSSQIPSEASSYTEYFSLLYRVRPASAVHEARQFRQYLTTVLRGQSPQCGLSSLIHANVNELTLVDVDVGNCEFLGAAGLDKLRVGQDSFKWTERWWRYGPMTRRRIIAEEQRWRDAHDTRCGKTRHSTEPPDLVPAAKIAGIYRELRKGLEDAKNEPGAADFYYGEMEMRRLAARKPTGTRGRGGLPGWVERALLHGYWAVSGYGLRASRSIGLLAAIILIAAALYNHPQFATMTAPPARIQSINPTTGAVTYAPEPPQKEPPFGTALEYAAREVFRCCNHAQHPT